ncbi:hypothetical protein GCM10009078_39280 [Cupriavidus gilardii]
MQGLSGRSNRLSSVVSAVSGRASGFDAVSGRVGGMAAGRGKGGHYKRRGEAVPVRWAAIQSGASSSGLPAG